MKCLGILGKALRDLGIKRIYYTSSEGTLIYEQYE